MHVRSPAGARRRARPRDYDVEGTATEYEPTARGASAAVSEPAHSLAFFDPDRQLYGTARSGTTLLFEGTHARRCSARGRSSSEGDGACAPRCRAASS